MSCANAALIGGVGCSRACLSSLDVATIIGFAMQNVLEVKNVTLPQSILFCLPSEMAQMKLI
jgi:hypothetical protein